jgi:uncharacterized protein YkwD
MLLWLLAAFLTWAQPDTAGQVVDLINSQRAAAGLPALATNPELGDAAQSYSQVLVATGCFDHTCGPVPDLSDRLGQAGYSDWETIGENIAAGYPTPDAVVNGWMSSPGHRSNILSPTYADVGIGLATGGEYGTYWTADFGTRGDDSDQ